MGYARHYTKSVVVSGSPPSLSCIQETWLVLRLHFQFPVRLHTESAGARKKTPSSQSLTLHTIGPFLHHDSRDPSGERELFELVWILRGRSDFKHGVVIQRFISGENPQRQFGNGHHFDFDDKGGSGLLVD